MSGPGEGPRGPPLSNLRGERRLPASSHVESQRRQQAHDVIATGGTQRAVKSHETATVSSDQAEEVSICNLFARACRSDFGYRCW